MAEEQFVSGEIVYLKSGGPPMVVVVTDNRDSGGQSHTCYWHASGEIREKPVPHCLLTKQKPEANAH